MSSFNEFYQFFNISTLMIFIVLMLPSVTTADIITLKSGKVIEGEIVDADERKLKIETGEETFSIKLKHIQNIKPKYKDAHIMEAMERIEKINAKEAVEAAEKAKVRETINSKKVEIFVTEWCPSCQALERYFKRKKIRYRSYDVEKDRSARLRYKSLGGKGIPVIKIDDTVIQGFWPKKIMRALKKE